MSAAMRQTMLRAIALSALWLGGPAMAAAPQVAPAQQADSAQTHNDLLRAMLCELRELRGALLHSQVLVPLVESNSRERVQVQARLSELEDERSEVDGHVQNVAARLTKIREILQRLSRPRTNNDDSEAAKREREQSKKNFESELELVGRELAILQENALRLSNEISRDQDRLVRLDQEFDRMQGQLLTVASVSGTECDSAPADRSPKDVSP